MRFILGREGENRMMSGRLILAAGLILSTAASLFWIGDDDRSPAPSSAASVVSESVTVSGRVILPDGAPAANAVVQAVARGSEPMQRVRTNPIGEFELRGVFGDGCGLHVISSDGRDQAIRFIAGNAI